MIIKRHTPLCISALHIIPDISPGIQDSLSECHVVITNRIIPCSTLHSYENLC